MENNTKGPTQKFIDIGGGRGRGAHMGETVKKKEEIQWCLGMKYANEWRLVVR